MTFFIVFLVFVSDKPLTRGCFFSLLLVYHNQKHISMQKEKSLYPLSLLTAFAASSPKGTPYGNAGNFAATAEAVPLGKVASRSDDGRGIP